jgi:hypothetical protein
VTTAVTSVLVGRWDQALVGVGRHKYRIPGQGFLCPRTAPSKGRMQKSGHPMPSHKFKIGDAVTLKPAISRNVPGGTYQVTKRLPENQGEFEYCIKNLEEPYARVARESELRKALTVF